MPEKKVRVVNSTTDVASLRVFVVSISPTIQAVFDVPQGGFVQNNHMNQGHRGFVAYEDFNEEVILTGSFILGTQNVKITITGDSAGGYNILQAVL